AEKVDPIYTFQSGDVEIDGEKINILNVDHTAIIADLVLTVQELTKQVRDLNKQVQTKEY
ncbi:tail fiber domain-containing protein, partial [Acinetobacter baumannii]|nr:tail fiber domain-containing protein [Acinetobacter baumannii]